MRILIAGASGYIGSAIVRAALDQGHVVGAIRRPESATPPQEPLEVVTSSLDDRERLAAAVLNFDAVIFAAAVPFDEEARAIALFIDILEGSGKPLLMMSGAMLLSHDAVDGRWREEIYAEHDAFVPPERSVKRYDTEMKLRRATMRGVHGMVIRPPLVWGRGASFQVPWMIDAGERLGWTFYLGAGLHAFSHVHVDDLGELVVRAAECGRGGSVYHASNGELSYRALAQAIAQNLGVDARSVKPAEVSSVMKPEMAATMFGRSLRISSSATRNELDWKPQRQDLIQDIIAGSYRAANSTDEDGM